VTEPTGHIVGTFVITREGTQFKSTHPFSLLASDDEWTSPILAEVGPDGNVWVIDWYSYIVQHNPTPPGFKTGKGGAYSTELRSSKFGRIYKIVPENFTDAQPKITLKGATPGKTGRHLEKHQYVLATARSAFADRARPEGCCSGIDQVRARFSRHRDAKSH
jgi:hypothetical protein